MVRIHQVDMAAASLPEARQRLERAFVSVRQRRQDVPAPHEELGEAGVRARILRASDRMAGDEMHMRRHVRLHLRYDGRLGRTDIGDDGAGLERSGDLLRHCLRRTDRHGDDDEIGVPCGFRGGEGIEVAELKLLGALQRRLAARRNRNRVGETLVADDAGKRRADEADPDQGDLLEVRFAHDFSARKSESAATTARFASSEPTLIRSAFGKP